MDWPGARRRLLLRRGALAPARRRRCSAPGPEPAETHVQSRASTAWRSRAGDSRLRPRSSATLRRSASQTTRRTVAGVPWRVWTTQAEARRRHRLPDRGPGPARHDAPRGARPSPTSRWTRRPRRSPRCRRPPNQRVRHERVQWARSRRSSETALRTTATKRRAEPALGSSGLPGHCVERGFIAADVTSDGRRRRSGRPLPARRPAGLERAGQPLLAVRLRDHDAGLPARGRTTRRTSSRRSSPAPTSGWTSCATTRPCGPGSAR